MLYCGRCYTRLDSTERVRHCPKCGRGADSSDPRTYLTRPFPGPLRIVKYAVITTIISVIAAFVAALFQMSQLSGH
jgi:hypothetical protein